MVGLDSSSVTVFLPSTFFYQEPKLVSSFEKFQKKMYFANTFSTKKHVLKSPNKVLSS